MSGIVTTADDFSGGESKSGILQWAIRFCQAPETFPVFVAWVRSIWPDCPFTDDEIGEDLINIHDLVGRALGAGR